VPLREKTAYPKSRLKRPVTPLDSSALENALNDEAWFVPRKGIFVHSAALVPGMPRLDKQLAGIMLNCYAVIAPGGTVPVP
jgi:hypothetical protein